MKKTFFNVYSYVWDAILLYGGMQVSLRTLHDVGRSVGRRINGNTLIRNNKNFYNNNNTVYCGREKKRRRGQLQLTYNRCIIYNNMTCTRAYACVGGGGGKPTIARGRLRFIVNTIILYWPYCRRREHRRGPSPCNGRAPTGSNTKITPAATSAGKRNWAAVNKTKIILFCQRGRKNKHIRMAHKHNNT